MSRGTLDPAGPARASVTGLSPSPAGLPRPFPCPYRSLPRSELRGAMHPGLGSAGFARRYSRHHMLCPLAGTKLFVFFSSGYLDVSVHRVPPARLWIHRTVAGVSPAGFPHSDTHGSLPICGSPWLFAACRVFLRLLVPRHPPCALPGLTMPASPPSVAGAGPYFFLLRFCLLDVILDH